MERFTGRIHRKLGIFDEIFPKNRKIRNYWYKIRFKPNKLGRKLRKIGFFAKTSNTLKLFALQLVAQVTIVENIKKKIRKIRDSTQYNKIGEKFSPIVIKILAFSQVPQQLHLKERKLLTHKNLKGAINRSYTYCEEDYGKCCKHTPFFFKCTIVSTGVTNTQITKTTNTYGYYKLQHKQI